MSIKFITEGTSKLTFDTVEDGQFFISLTERLCQKVNSYSYSVIAHPDGRPYAKQEDNCSYDFNIKKILPKVTKIEFN